MCVCVVCVVPFASYRCCASTIYFRGRRCKFQNRFVLRVFVPNKELRFGRGPCVSSWVGQWTRLDSLFCDQASDATGIVPQLTSCSHAFLCYNKPLAQTVSSLSEPTCSMRHCELEIFAPTDRRKNKRMRNLFCGSVAECLPALATATEKGSRELLGYLWQDIQLLARHSGTRAFLCAIASTVNVVSTPPSTYTCHLLQRRAHTRSRPNMVNFARCLMKSVRIPVWIGVGVAIPFMPSAMV